MPLSTPIFIRAWKFGTTGDFKRSQLQCLSFYFGQKPKSDLHPKCFLNVIICGLVLSLKEATRRFVV